MVKADERSKKELLHNTLGVLAVVWSFSYCAHNPRVIYSPFVWLTMRLNRSLILPTPPASWQAGDSVHLHLNFMSCIDLRSRSTLLAHHRNSRQVGWIPTTWMMTCQGRWRHCLNKEAGKSTMILMENRTYYLFINRVMTLLRR